MQSKRLGRFAISEELIDAAGAEVRTVMSQCIILHVDPQPWRGRYEYTAISWRFAPVPKGGFIPRYVWEFESGGGFHCRQLDGGE